VTGPRGTDVLRLALGAAALVGPGTLLRACGAVDGVGDRRVVRVLGARYVAQAAVGIGRPGRWVRTADVVVDLVHAASMVGLAALDPPHRRAALVSAAAATGFALADLRSVTS
jgi:hypothetical protein